MLRFIISILLTLSFQHSAVGSEFKLKGLQTYSPKPIQEIVLSNINGEQLNLEELNGNVVLLHFWASWCSHCATGMKSLNALQKALKKEHIIVVPVSQDFKGREVIEQFYKTHKLSNLTSFIDPSHELFRELGVTSLPTTIIIDSQGLNVGIIRSNVDWTNPAYINFLRTHIHTRSNDNKKYIELLEKQKVAEKKAPEIIIPDEAQTKVIIKN